jgi:hypothetical protein
VGGGPRWAAVRGGTLQSAGQVVYFMREHLGRPIPSPAVMQRIGNRFRDAVKHFVARERHPHGQVREG